MRTCSLNILFLLSLLLPFARTSAQTQVITGHIAAALPPNGGQPLPYASVMVMLLPDSSFVNGTVSDGTGAFRLPFRRKEKRHYLLKASYTGYRAAFKRLASDKDSVSVGTLLLKEDTQTLDGIVVTAPAQPVEQKGDTTVFNAAAFPTPEGAYLEALVRRIPGLDYNAKNHSMTFNGYPVREITVNGKDFFKGSPQTALENLPAGFVSRLKVYDKPTEEEKATGMRSGKKNYVLDLQTKRELNGTLNMAAEAGYGSRKRRDLNGKAMLFREGGDNFMLTGQSTNRFYTTPYEGNLSNAFGTNLSHRFGEKLEASGSIGYRSDRNGSRSTGYNEQYMAQETRYASTESRTLSKWKNAHGNADLKWETGEKTTAHLSADFSFSGSRSEDSSREATFNANPGLDLQDPFAAYGQTDKGIRINENGQQSFTNSRNLTYNVQASIVQKLNKKGNSLSASFGMAQNRSENQNQTAANTCYFQLRDEAGGDSTLLRHQFIRTPETQRHYTANVAYTQAISPKARLQIAYGISAERDKLDGNTYDLPPLAPGSAPDGHLSEGYEKGETDSLSNQSRSRTLRHTVSFRFNYNGDVWGVRASLSASPQRRSISQRTGNHAADTTACSVEWRPSFSILYKKGDNYATFNYGGGTSQPSLSDLIAPTDYSSPLDIARSNPNLRPSFAHRAHVMFNNFKKGVSASFAYMQEFRSVSLATTYDAQTGGRETFPVNVNGNYSLSGNLSYDRRIRSFKVHAKAGNTYRQLISLISGGTEDLPDKSATRNTGFNAGFRLSYLPAWGNIDLNGQWAFVQSRNSLQNAGTYTRNYTLGVNAAISLPLRFSVETDAACRLRNGTGTASDEENELLWNVKVSWKFLKQQAKVSVYWADILGQRKSLNRFATANGFYERYEDQLHGYFMLSLQYRFEQTK